MQPSASQNEVVKPNESGVSAKSNVCNTSVESVLPSSSAENTDLSVTADMSTNISNCINVTSDEGKNVHGGNEVVKTSSHVALTKESHCDDKKNMSTAWSNVSIASVQLTKLNTTRINEVS